MGQLSTFALHVVVSLLIMSTLTDVFPSSMSDILSIPTPYFLPLPLLAFLTIAYFLAAPSFPTEKARAYVLSTLSSFTMSIISLPSIYCYLTGGLQLVYAAGSTGWMRQLGRFGASFFGTFLFGETLPRSELR